VTRFSGQALPADSRIAVFANDAIGNFVVVTPLLQMLREAWCPATVDFYGGRRTWELQAESDLFDWTYPLWGTAPAKAVEAMLGRMSGAAYDLVVNVESTYASKVYAGVAAGSHGLVCGPCVADDGRGDLPFADDERGRLWQDRDWIAQGLALRYECLTSGFIGEIFCRLCYLQGPIPRYRVPRHAPPVDVPDLLISTAASLEEKLWPFDCWVEVLKWAGSHGLSVGLLGASPAAQRQFWQGSTAEDQLVATGRVTDLRGTMTLPQVAGALAHARLVLTIDNGILHLAAAGEARTVGLFRHGFHRLWAPPAPNLAVLTSGNDGPVAEIALECVLKELERAL
jgi:ADP-heptose:LPS heptosyltransferase